MNTPAVALITGAASGIGRHWAAVLARQPSRYQLVLTDVNAAGLREAFARYRADEPNRLAAAIKGLKRAGVLA